MVVASPKPFAGYSDNTNLLNWLWNLGMPATTADRRWSISAAAAACIPCRRIAACGSLTGGDVDLHPVRLFNEDELDWSDPASGPAAPAQPSPGWSHTSPAGW